MQVIYGLHPVLEFLRSGGEDIEAILLAPDKKGSAVEEILLLAGRRGIPVRRESRDTMDRLVAGKHHQGILSLCRDFAYSSIDSVIAPGPAGNQNSLVLLLDSVMDPQNLGSLIRSAHCFGTRAVVIPKNRAASVTPAVVKVSAGSARHTPVCQVANIAQTMELLKEEGYWIYGADADRGRNCRDLGYEGPIALVLGSEGSGLRPLVRQKCDFLIRIPMGGVIDSLNVSVAGGILLYEMMQGGSRNRMSFE